MINLLAHNAHEQDSTYNLSQTNHANKLLNIYA